LAAEWLQKYDIPIIISSARGDLSDKIMGLQIGADYYLPKPYDPKEMYAVIQSLLRRSKKVIKTKENSLFKHNRSQMTIEFNGEVLNLTNGEYEVLAALVDNKNAILSREQIVQSCDSLTDSYSKSLDVIIGRLRTKLKEDSKNIKYLHSIRGLGYKLTQ